MDLSDSESDVDDVEPDSALMQIRMTAVESLCPGKPVSFGPFSHIYLYYSIVPKCCPILLHHVASLE